jgi:hypothetical protein
MRWWRNGSADSNTRADVRATYPGSHSKAEGYIRTAVEYPVGDPSLAGVRNRVGLSNLVDGLFIAVGTNPAIPVNARVDFRVRGASAKE